MNLETPEIDLVDAAWNAREFADPNRSGVKVGAAVNTENGSIYTGWNKEGLWMTSIHAEVAAIAQMKAGEKIGAIAVVAETSFFTPCGACLDWIMKYRSDSTIVLIANREENWTFTLNQLVPKYPKE